MSSFNHSVKQYLSAVCSFYLKEDLNIVNDKDQLYYKRVRSVFLNLCLLGECFLIPMEKNIALYKFVPFPIYIEKPAVSTNWFDLFADGKTNEDVVRYFCLANNIDYNSFHQVNNTVYDETWYHKWLTTPIENFESFGLSSRHAVCLSTGGPCW
jgi:hypothetical protein